MPVIVTADRAVASVTATESEDWQVVSTPTGFRGITSADFSDNDKVAGFVIFENGEDYEVYDTDDDTTSTLLEITNISGTVTISRPSTPYKSSNGGDRVSAGAGTHTLVVGMGAGTAKRLFRDTNPTWKTLTSGDATPDVSQYFKFKTNGTTTITAFDGMESGKGIFIVKRGNSDITIADGAGISLPNDQDITLTTANPVAIFVEDNGVAVYIGGTPNAASAVDTLAELKAYPAGTTGDRVYMRGRTSLNDGAQGSFYWLTGNQSALVTADTQNAIYVPPDSDNTGASGVWAREFVGAEYGEWFGLSGDANDATATSNTTALSGFINTLEAFSSPSGLVSNGDFRIDGALIDTKRGFEIDGQGTADLSRTGTTFRWADTSANGSMMDMRSTHSVVYEGFRFRSGSQTGKDSCIIFTANESPALSSLRTLYRDCAFQTDSPTTFTSAMVNLKSTANTSFYNSQFVGGTGLKIGKDTDVDPDTAGATLANGISSDISTLDCIWVADIILENCYNWTSISDYWGLNSSTNTIGKISCTGLEEARAIVVINSMIDPAGTSSNAATWFDGPTNASGDHGPCTFIGGQYTGANVAINLPSGYGAVIGGKFVATNTPTAGIVLGPDFLGAVEAFTENDFTDLTSSGAKAIDDQRSVHKMVDADSTPSLAAGRLHQIADAPPTGGISDFDDIVEGAEYTVFSNTAPVKINHNASILCPGNQSLYFAPGDPPIRLKARAGKVYVYYEGTPKKVMNAYGEQTCTISSGRITPYNANIIIASETSGAPDNLSNVDIDETDDFVFKRGAMIAARINSADEPITILESGNVHTWNGYPATMTDPNKTYWFRVDTDGLGMTLMPDGLSVLELHNDPLISNDAPLLFFFGQSNAGASGVAGAATSGALSYVQIFELGDLTFSAFDTSGSAPFSINNHISDPGVTGSPQSSPFASFAQLWEDNQAADSLPILYSAMISQGGQRLSATTTTANGSKWNPDRYISATGGTPAPATDGYYRIRYEGLTSTSDYSLFEWAQQVIRAACKEVEALGKRPRILGVVWTHGESDALSAGSAAEYGMHLDRLHGALANAAGVTELPMILSYVRSENYAQRATVNAAMDSFVALHPYAQIIDPFDFASYNASDTGDSPPHLGIFEDGIHYTKTAADEYAEAVYAKTIGRNFYGLSSSKSIRANSDHRKLSICVTANGSGSNDNGTTYDEFLDNGQATAVKRIEDSPGVHWVSTSQTIVSEFDPTTGRFIAPYAGTYRVRGRIRTNIDAGVATNSTAGTQLRIYSNETIGAGSTAGTLWHTEIAPLLDAGTGVAGFEFMTMNAIQEIEVIAGEEIIVLNNNYRQSSSNYEWLGSIELINAE